MPYFENIQEGYAHSTVEALASSAELKALTETFGEAVEKFSKDIEVLTLKIKHLEERIERLEG